jgi:AraC-like DNA-binding protein
VPFLELLATLGAAQGALILLLILFRFRHHKNSALALLILVFSLRLGTIPSWNASILTANPWLWPATTPLPFLFGPLLWWYARELSRDTPAAPPLLPLHFLPYAAETVAVAVTVMRMSPQAYGDFVASVFAGRPPLWLPIRNGMKVAVNIVYIVLASRIAFGTAVKRLSPPRRLWLGVLVVVPTCSLFAFGYVAVNPAVSARLAEGVATPFTILAALMALLIYTFSLLVLIAPSGLECSGIPLGYRSTPAMSEEECRRLAERVRGRLDDGAFQNPGLSLADMALQLDVHPNRVSQAVNHSCRVPFRQLLNRRRLEYFTERTRRGALATQSILELAIEAGFPSKSTFNRVFKKQTGMTPSAYAEQVLETQAAKGEEVGR